MASLDSKGASPRPALRRIPRGGPADKTTVLGSTSPRVEIGFVCAEFRVESTAEHARPPPTGRLAARLGSALELGSIVFVKSPDGLA
jgi:hypothetical protein